MQPAAWAWLLSNSMKTTMTSIKLPQPRFRTQRAIQGWFVVDDRDGRPVSDLTEAREARKLAERLNLAAYGGSESLQRAFGAE